MGTQLRFWFQEASQYTQRMPDEKKHPESLSGEPLARAIKQRALELGFQLCGIAPAVQPETLAQLKNWITKGFVGELSYIPRREEAYAHPSGVLKTVRSVIVLGMNYHSGQKKAPEQSARGQIAKYAQGEVDYHDLIRDRLQSLADFLHQAHPGCRTRPVVDTAPLLERDFARLAGLGWFGKNTMLINKGLGSWLFLAALLTDIELPSDRPFETSHCGTCTRCLEACPTDAFPEPYVLDASRCISYLTIELRDRQIPREFRSGIQDWVFGCDICNDVCPWNNKTPTTDEPMLQPRPAPDALELLQMSEQAFSRQYGKTPLSRPGYQGIRRNAAIVLGNKGNLSDLPALVSLRDEQDPIVREAISWAIAEIQKRHQNTNDAPKAAVSPSGKVS